MTTSVSPAAPPRSPSRLLAVAAVLLLVLLAVAVWTVLRSAQAGDVLPWSSGGGPGGTAAVGDEGGDLPDSGVGVTDVHLVALSRMDPELLDAVQRAAARAAEEGVELRITSGWRSTSYQQQLLDDAIGRYGEQEARRIVQTPDRSRHTTGDAVDIGPTDAAFWMLRHGSDFGLCQVYANEVWHYELLVPPGGECPPLQDDAS